MPQMLDRASAGTDGSQARFSVDVFCKRNPIGRGPRDCRGRRINFRSQIARCTARNRHDKNITAGWALVAHQAFDECHALAIGRNTWSCDLKLRRVDVMHLSRARLDAVKVRNVPVCVAGAMGRRSDPGLPVRSPVVFIDVHVGRSDLSQRVRGEIDGRNPLLIDVTSHYPSQWSHRLQRPRRSRHSIDKENRELRPVRRKTGSVGISLEIRALDWCGGVNRCGPQLRRGGVGGQVGKEHELSGIGRPRDTAKRKLAFDFNRLRRIVVERFNRKFSIDDVGDALPVGGNFRLLDPPRARHRIENGGSARSPCLAQNHGWSE